MYNDCSNKFLYTSYFSIWRLS
uniref:Uncharacterized protein n=1 Tax=Arundo donax TaxID=35708 RepID=A0A0A9FFZ5_ARUDO